MERDSHLTVTSSEGVSCILRDSDWGAQIEKCTFVVSLDASHCNNQGIHVPAQQNSLQCFCHIAFELTVAPWFLGVDYYGSLFAGAVPHPRW